MHHILLYVHQRYNAPEIWITENGVSAPKEGSKSNSKAVKDDFRLDFFRQYIKNLCQAVSEGVNVSHYYAWSFMDNFEWRDGYAVRFGIVHVDFKSGSLERRVKRSGEWLSTHFFKVSAS